MSDNITGPSYEVLIRYERKVIDQGAILYWQKNLSSVFILGFLYLIAIVTLTALGSLEFWFGGAMIGIAVVVFSILYWAYRNVRSRSISIFEEMNSKETTWIFTNDHFSTRNDIGTSEIVWRMLTGVIKSDDVWLFLYKDKSYSVFPVNNVEQQIRDFIENQVTLNGGKIIT